MLMTAVQTEKTSVAIEVKNLKKYYQMGEVKVKALRGSSFEVMDGEFVVVLGPSGSGKSTLLNMIGGMDNPTDGSVKFYFYVMNQQVHLIIQLERRFCSF